MKMLIEDKLIIGGLALGVVAILVGAYLLKDEVGKLKKDLSQPVTETVQSARDIGRALGSGDAPQKESQNQNDATLGYLESIHDVVTSPVESFKVIWNGWFGK